MDIMRTHTNVRGSGMDEKSSLREACENVTSDVTVMGNTRAWRKVREM
jgi:hypothetical protein